jgi:putative transposase
MRVRKSAHTTYKTEYHVVWTPRYRHKLFQDEGVKKYAEEVLKHIDRLAGDIEVIEVSVQPDHVHMVIIIPPRIAVASVIQYIKTTSGGLLKCKFPYINRLVWGRSGIWSVGYFVSTVGINESVVLNYVRSQDEDDRGQQQFDF